MRRLDEIWLAPTDRAAIEEAVRVLRHVAPVEEIVLFGSKCRGEDDRESDIDLLVLTSRPLARRERHAVMDALFPIEIARGVALSPLIVSTAEWRSGILSVLPIHAEVEEQGVVA